jgi:hypothetical protein
VIGTIRLRRSGVDTGGRSAARMRGRARAGPDCHLPRMLRQTPHGKSNPGQEFLRS